MCKRKSDESFEDYKFRRESEKLITKLKLDGKNEQGNYISLRWFKTEINRLKRKYNKI